MDEFERVTNIFNCVLKNVDESKSCKTRNLIKQAYRYSISKGILFLSEKHENMLQPIGTTLLPLAISAKLYEHGKDLSHKYNILYEHVANDYDFLRETLKNVVSSDPFNGRLWKIYEEAREMGYKPNVRVSINRNDVMVDQSQLKQVELNTIAVGMASLSQSAADVHRFVAGQLGLDTNAIPKESISTRLADALLLGYELYCRQKYKNSWHKVWL